jgi:hypothetical protein
MTTKPDATDVSAGSPCLAIYAAMGMIQWGRT